MKVNSINNTAFGKLRIKRDPINASYLDGFVGEDDKILSALNISLTNINAKTGNKYVDFRINLESSNPKKDKRADIWALRVSDSMNANTLAKAVVPRNASRAEYINAIRQLAVSTPRYDSVCNTRELLNKFQ